ncbi:NAD(P)-binding domain-containing protein [Caballeronia mineralivorans]|uniref:NADPH-dependent F420 reductase n=1 Tax=Caballeronia mineralivorans TaxID=2010198 RepID=UPI0023F28731|nr:NAD(P)-binding domain-containing protein [Caballeronia mineralivorans]MDB5784907.1 oxidoreductase [Caballeronia mineralivorans]
MKIGIIGAGNIGRVLALRWVDHGHAVLIGNSRGPATLADVASETGAKPAELADVVRGAAVIVVTIPEKKVLDLPAGLFDNVAETTVVIDTGNYYRRERDGRIDGIESGMMESAWVAQQIGHPVIKAFNNIYADHLRNLGKPEGTPGRIALPVSGDNADAKAVVMQLVNETGFDAFDNGRINNSWRQQQSTPVYTKDFDLEGLKAGLQKAEKTRTPQWTATDKSPGSFDKPA